MKLPPIIFEIPSTSKTFGKEFKKAIKNRMREYGIECAEIMRREATIVCQRHALEDLCNTTANAAIEISKLKIEE